MRILAFYFGHDTNVCLLENGDCVALIEKERETRLRHDQGGWDLMPILERYDWSPDSIDFVAFNPSVRRDARGDLTLLRANGDPFTRRSDFREPGLRCIPEQRYSEHQLQLLGREYCAYAVDHHLAHIAGALFTSPFEEAGVLSADGGGDWRYGALAYGSANRIHEIEYGLGQEAIGRQLNIGSTWGSVGEHNFGFERLEGAGKLMGLASYAESDETMVDAVTRMANYAHSSPFPCFLWPDRDQLDLDPKDKYAQSVAASLQEMTTREYLKAARRLKDAWSSEYVVLTGGCSMNCVANTAVHASGLFKSSWVPAQPHDGGLALGIALFTYHHILNQPREPREWTPFLGNDIPGSNSFDYYEEVVNHLEAGKTVGLCVGKAESGPRALGHRSILADPRLPHVRDLVNQKVKRREWFRPFAPMVLEEDYDRYFSPRVPSRYMSYVVDVTAPNLPGITHVDGTARPQVVTRNGDPVPRRLLEAWKARTGCGVLLNTSFNCQEPLVDTIEQARATWRRTELDVLATPLGVETKSKATNPVLDFDRKPFFAAASTTRTTDATPAEMLFREAQSCFERSEIDDAVRVMKQAIEKEPTNIKYITGFGKILHKTQQLDEAEAIFRHAVKISPERVTWGGLASVLRAKGEYNEAREIDQCILSQSPFYSRSRANVKLCKQANSGRQAPVKITVLTCVWKRPRLTRFVMSHYASMRDQLKGVVEIDLLAVGSEGESSRQLAEPFGFAYIEFPNRPLGAKWNAGLRAIQRTETEAVVIAGSDDLVNAEYFQLVGRGTKAGLSFIGLVDMYFLDLKTRRLVLWKGYHSDRAGDPIGLGRCLGRHVLDEANWQLWENHVESSLDANMAKVIGPLLTRSHQCALLHTESDSAIGIDIKSDTNMWSFDEMTRVADCNDVGVDILDSVLGTRSRDLFLIPV